MNKMKNRQSTVLKMAPRGVDGFLVTDLSNIRYLCGYSGSAGMLLLRKNGAVFFTDFRYQEQSATEVGDNAKIRVVKDKTLLKELVNYLSKSRSKSLMIENSLKLSCYKSLKDLFKGTVRIAKGFVEDARKVKDETEFASLKKAFSIADAAFAELIPHIKPRISEIEIAARLEFIMRMKGSEGPSFPTIVAAGKRSACPHAQPTENKLRSGEMVKIDFGATVNGYHSDMTRTVFLGSATEKFKKVYEIVLRAQTAAIKGIKPGASCREIDKLARDLISKEGYKDNFGHGLGHSLGLDIHESPSFSTKSDDNLETDMILTVEPGIYIPDWGGIRVEDVYRVTTEKPERFTSTPNSLLEIR